METGDEEHGVSETVVEGGAVEETDKEASDIDTAETEDGGGVDVVVEVFVPCPVKPEHGVT